MDNNKSDITVADIISHVGSDRIRVAIYGDGPPSGKSGKKPGEKALAQAAWRNEFSARLFDVVEGLCLDAGISCPRHLFSFQHDTTPREPQGATQ